MTGGERRSMTELEILRKFYKTVKLANKTGWLDDFDSNVMEALSIAEKELKVIEAKADKLKKVYEKYKPLDKQLSECGR